MTNLMMRTACLLFICYVVFSQSQAQRLENHSKTSSILQLQTGFGNNTNTNASFRLISRQLRQSMSDTKISCYVCTYHKEGEEVQGYEGCLDPFDSFQIPEVVCDGPCSKYVNKKEGSYMIMRNCLPRCKEKNTEDGSVQRHCCDESLCNVSNSMHSRQLLLYLFAILVLCRQFFTNCTFESC